MNSFTLGLTWSRLFRLFRLIPALIVALLFLVVAYNRLDAQPLLLETGGSFHPISPNLATSGTAFAKDVLPGYAEHAIAHLNDGKFGNSFSWIGNSANSFVGINLGTHPVAINRIAFGRDNTDTFQDRFADEYFIQFTTEPNPTAATTAWIPLTTIDLRPGTSIPSPHLRHLFAFPTVLATGIRIIMPGNGTAIDELEIYPAATVLSATPSSGSVQGGTLITLAGTFLSGTTEVRFGGTPSPSILSVTASSITCITPPGPAGPQEVAVTTAGLPGVPAPAAFTYLSPPTITQGTTRIPTTATSLTLAGTGFDVSSPGANTVTLSSGSASVIASTATTLTLSISGILPGTLTASVTSNGLSSGPPVAVATAVSSPPPAVTIENTQLDENVPPGTAVGTLTSGNLTAGSPCTFVPTEGAGDDDNAAFNIQENTLHLVPSPDFETKNQYSLRVAAVDEFGARTERSFNLTIRNVNEAPSFTRGGEIGLPSGTSTAQTFSQWARNIDDGDSTVTQSLTFQVIGNTNPALFTVPPAIDPTTGTLTFTPAGTSGTAVIHITLRDDNSINGSPAITTAPQSFIIAVLQEPITAFTLSEVGGSFRTDVPNLARSGTSISSSEIGVPPHATAKVNDGIYGNSSSWIGGTSGSSIGVLLPTPSTIGSFAFSRDNTGTLIDRTFGDYTFQYTRTPGLTSANASSAEWIVFGTTRYGTFTAAPSLRHVFSFFEPLTGITGFRIITPDGAAIDEIELYASPTATPDRAPGMSSIGPSPTNFRILGSGAIFAQSFITPPGKSHRLNSATIRIAAAPGGAALSLYRDSPSGITSAPGELITSFISPSNFIDGNNTFMASGEIELEPNTAYWLAYQNYSGEGLLYLAADPVTGGWFQAGNSAHFINGLGWRIAYPSPSLIQFAVSATPLDALPPLITGITPNSGPAFGGTAVTISGNRLAGATSVTIGGNPVLFLSNTTPNSLTFITPPGVAGPREIVITTPAGSNAAGMATFTYLDPPTIQPSSANLTIPLIIHGTGFETTLPTANQVSFFPSGTGTVTASSSTTLTISDISGVAKGPLYATVTTVGGASGAPVQVATVQNSPPTHILLSPSAFRENNPPNSVVANLSATDPDSGQSHSFRLVPGAGAADNASFTISGTNLVFHQVADYETKDTYSIRIVANDGNGGLLEQALTLNILDGNESPSFAVGEDIVLPAGSTSAVAFPGWVGLIDDGDSRATQQLSFQITSLSDASLFAVPPFIDAQTGTLHFTPSGTIGVATVTVTLTDDNSIGGEPAITSPPQSFAIALGTDLPIKLRLAEVTGTFRSDALNIATAGIPVSSGEIGLPPHQTSAVNDGSYGNSSSWIGNGSGSWVGVILPAPASLGSIAFGRDNTGVETDRARGVFTLQYSMTPGLTPENLESATWQPLSTLPYGTFTAAPARRHLYNLSNTLTGITAVRIITPSGAAIDELELYPTPAASPTRPPGLSTITSGSAGLQGIVPRDTIGQCFVTPPGTGLRLTSVTIRLAADSTAEPTVSIYADQAWGLTGLPGREIAVLNRPPNLIQGENVFTASTPIDLEPNTAYWIGYRCDNALTYLHRATTTATGGWFIALHSGSKFEEEPDWIADYPGVPLMQFSVQGTANTPSQLQTWRQQFFSTLSNIGRASNLSDPDADGESNLLEFATGQNPLARTRAATSLASGSLGYSFLFTRSTAAAADNLRFRLEWNPDLARDSWRDAGAGAPVMTSSSGSLQSMKLDIPPSPGASRRFFRLAVSP